MLHPIALLGAQYLMTAVAVSFTSSRSGYRLVLLPLVATCCAICVPACKKSLDRGAWAATVGGYSITYLFQFVSLVLLSGCSYENDSHITSASDQHVATAESTKKSHTNYLSLLKSVWTRLKFGISAASSFRWTGTRREVKNIPHFSTEDPKYIPGKGTFLWQSAMKVSLCYLFLDLMALGNDEEQNEIQFHSAKVPLFTRSGDVSAEELGMRIGATFGAGLGIYCAQEGLQSLLALIAVGLGFSDVKYWRPRFGPISDSYSLRKFWR